MKYAAEQHLRASGVPWTIVRATAFLETWTALLEQTASCSGRPLVFGRGDNPINFVSVDDVAALVERVVVDPSTRGQVFEIGGPACRASALIGFRVVRLFRNTLAFRAVGITQQSASSQMLRSWDLFRRTRLAWKPKAQTPMCKSSRLWDRLPSSARSSGSMQSLLLWIYRPRW